MRRRSPEARPRFGSAPCVEHVLHGDPRFGREPPGSLGEVERRPGHRHVRGDEIRRVPFESSRFRRIVPASPRTAGPVSACAEPSCSTWSSDARCSGAMAVRIGDARGREQRLRDRRCGHQIVRREDGGGVIQRAEVVRQPEGLAADVAGEPLPEEGAVVVGGRDRRSHTRAAPPQPSPRRGTSAGDVPRGPAPRPLPQP